MKKMKVAAFAVISAMMASGPAMAATATATANLNVSLTLVNHCKVTGDTIAFGSVTGLLDDNANGLDASGTISVKCTKGATYSIGLDAGKGNGATTSARKMTKGTPSATAPTIGYTLALGSYSGVGATGPAEEINVDANVYSQDTPEAGAYNDTVTVTVTY